MPKRAARCHTASTPPAGRIAYLELGGLDLSEFGRSFGVANTSVRRYLDELAATFVVRQLRPWHENLAKRQVKATKIYIADSGLLHALLGIADSADLRGHPKVGARGRGSRWTS